MIISDLLKNSEPYTKGLDIYKEYKMGQHLVGFTLLLFS